jgi:hypothetical protein
MIYNVRLNNNTLIINLPGTGIFMPIKFVKTEEKLKKNLAKEF